MPGTGLALALKCTLKFNKMQKYQAYIQACLRLAIGAGYLVFGLDRLGVWGPYGAKGVAWGDWPHFMAYAAQVMGFLPYAMANVLAVVATIGEIVFGAMLLVGLFTRLAAIGSGVLSLCFAVAMALSGGITSPMGSSVFTLSAASFLLATVTSYKWSIDNLRTRRQTAL